jgi:hypothetical protein
MQRTSNPTPPERSDVKKTKMTGSQLPVKSPSIACSLHSAVWSRHCWNMNLAVMNLFGILVDLLTVDKM